MLGSQAQSGGISGESAVRSWYFQESVFWPPEIFHGVNSSK